MKNTKEVQETTIKKRGNYIHIETQGCIINIYPNLCNIEGQPTTSISISPYDRYMGEPVWKIIDGSPHIRIVQQKEIMSR